MKCGIPNNLPLNINKLDIKNKIIVDFDVK